MKRLNRLVDHFPILPLALGVAALLWHGCVPPPPSSCDGPIVPNQAFPVTTLGYGAGLQLDVTEVDAISLRRGDQVTLLFPCEPVLGTPVPAGMSVAINTSDHTAVISVLNTNDVTVGTTYTIPFSTPSYEFNVHVVGDVWPGDANADGRRNMHDLMPIALGIRYHINGPVPSAALSYPPSVTEMNIFRDIPDWSGPGSEFEFADRMINFKHADCNLDGRINLQDIEYLRTVLGPVMPPNFLMDAVNGMQLRAVYDPNFPIVPTFDEDGNCGLRIAFDIEVSDPQGYVDSLFGVLFTRPVAEAADYQVDTTTFNFPLPNIFNTNVNETMLWGQRFWDEIDMYNTQEDCAGAIDKPLDVGVFKVNGPLSTVGSTNSTRCGNCQVTLLDVLRVGEPLPSTLDFQHHLINGTAYTFNETGLTATPLQCESNSTPIDLSVLCKTKDSLLIRDRIEDNGRGNTPTHQAWNSPDIWVRHLDDSISAHQDPTLGQDAYIYVRVLNPTCRLIDQVSVNIYAADYNSFLRGADMNLVGTISGISIPPFGKTILRHRWPFSSGQAYSSVSAPSFALMATVGTPSIPAPSFGSADFVSEVLKFPTMAMRNIKTLRDVDGNLTPTEFFLDLSNLSGTIQLRLDLVQGSTSHPASNYGNLTIQTNGVSSAINFVSPASGHYAVEPNNVYAQLNLTASAISNPIKVSFTPGPVSPSGPLSYTYLLTMKVGSTTYPGLALKINLP